MSGSRAMPHPWKARLAIARSGCGGRYAPIVHATESPRTSIRGNAPGTLPGRSIGATLGVSDLAGPASAGRADPVASAAADTTDGGTGTAVSPTVSSTAPAA